MALRSAAVCRKKASGTAGRAGIRLPAAWSRNVLNVLAQRGLSSTQTPSAAPNVRHALLMHLNAERVRVPPWIAFWAAGLIGSGGVCVILLALHLHSLVRWLASGLLAAMAAMTGWISGRGRAR